MTLLTNWTNETKGHGCGISIPQASKESEIAVVPPTPTHKIVYMDRIKHMDEFRPMKNYQPNPDPDNH